MQHAFGCMKRRNGMFRLRDYFPPVQQKGRLLDLHKQNQLSIVEMHHFGFSWNACYTEELENAQLYQHWAIKHLFGKIWKIPNHKRDMAKRHYISQMPSCNVPSGQSFKTMKFQHKPQKYSPDSLELVKIRIVDPASRILISSSGSLTKILGLCLLAPNLSDRGRKDRVSMQVKAAYIAIHPLQYACTQKAISLHSWYLQNHIW